MSHTLFDTYILRVTKYKNCQITDNHEKVSKGS